jgi:hypothetical protein
MNDMSNEGERLARLETKVDLVLQRQDEFRTLFEKHDERLKHLEHVKAGVYSIAATIGVLSAILVEGVRKVLTH